MRVLYEEKIAVAAAIKGQLLSGSDKIVPPPNWVYFARHCWPTKTAAHLATIAGKDERTAKRWLSGEFDPPIAVVIALFGKMFERQ